MARLTLPALSRVQVRAVDQWAIDDYGLPGIVLMENAGRGATTVLLEAGCAGRVLVCAGKGNNGGDGYVIARHLEIAGLETRTLVFCDEHEVTGDARTHLTVLERSGAAVAFLGKTDPTVRLAAELRDADWVVDALLGTGLVGRLRAPLPDVIACLNASAKPIFAVDLPSGLDCDTGLPFEGGCVRARLTATFVARKRGFDNPASSTWTGPVHTVDIGVPRALLQRLVR